MHIRKRRLSFSELRVYHASVRQKPAPWAGKFYSELSDDLKRRFDAFALTVFEIGSSAIPDEVRDLFIGLRSGTALTFLAHERDPAIYACGASAHVRAKT